MFSEQKCYLEEGRGYGITDKCLARREEEKEKKEKREPQNNFLGERGERRCDIESPLPPPPLYREARKRRAPPSKERAGKRKKVCERAKQAMQR